MRYDVNVQTYLFTFITVWLNMLKCTHWDVYVYINTSRVIRYDIYVWIYTLNYIRFFFGIYWEVGIFMEYNTHLSKLTVHLCFIYTCRSTSQLCIYKTWQYQCTLLVLLLSSTLKQLNVFLIKWQFQKLVSPDTVLYNLPLLFKKKHVQFCRTGETCLKQVHDAYWIILKYSTICVKSIL